VKRGTIIILEDNPDRLREFESAVHQLGSSYRLRTWRDANRMMAECHDALGDAALISLDHDLNKEHDHSPDPGDGVAVASFLARLPQICPVILHTSNAERVWSMHNELRFGGWESERVMPLEADWIARSWLPQARRLLEKFAADEKGYYQPQISGDHSERFNRALISLYGLAIGDGIGEMMFSRPDQAFEMIMKDDLPAGPWWPWHGSFVANLRKRLWWSSSMKFTSARPTERRIAALHAPLRFVISNRHKPRGGCWAMVLV
jgi:hypothetical protein